MRAIALTNDTSALTAIGNDYSLHRVLDRQVEALANEGKIVIGTSTSGISDNVFGAIKLANKLGCKTNGFSDRGGGEVSSLCGVNLVVSADDTPLIREMHIVIGHTMCHLIENRGLAT